MGAKTRVPLGTEIFTTTQAAKLMKCSVHVVIKECDRGNLKCYGLSTTPGGRRARRISRAALVAYCRANGLAHALETLGESPS